MKGKFSYWIGRRHTLGMWSNHGCSAVIRSKVSIVMKFIGRIEIYSYKKSKCHDETGFGFLLSYSYCFVRSWNVCR